MFTAYIYNGVRFSLKTTESWILFLAIYLFKSAIHNFVKG